jgi:hypothetical protein
MSGFEDYKDLNKTGYTSVETVAPEDEFFHSVYISGQSRKNHINVVEQAGKMQLRGVEYNLDEVSMVIVHTKEILSKVVSKSGKDSTECFSFKEGAAPWFGTSKLQDGSRRQCPQTSAERAVVEYCNPCRSQIIVAGIYCRPDGAPVVTEEKKPVFVFLRAKGMKYSNIANYLSELYKEDLSPIFEPVTEKSKEFEKKVVNQKRFVTKITKGSASSKHGMKDVFVLSKGQQLPKEAVLKILTLSKNTLDKFNEKFDWSRRGTTSYDESEAQAEGIMTMEPVEGSTSIPTDEAAKQQEKEKQSAKLFSFDDIEF